MLATNILPHYTYSDYEHWEGRWEIIAGIPYAMSPMPIPRHQQLAVKLSNEFTNELIRCTNCIVYQPLDLYLQEDTIVQPDMLVVCKPIVKKYLDFAPALVLEILSPSSEVKDRVTKYSLYEQKGIPYYLIVSTDPEEVEVYQLEHGHYKPLKKGRIFTCDLTFEECNASIDFGKIW